jgi:aminopeptidase YwaD
MATPDGGTAHGAEEFDGGRALAHVETLAGEIGSRPSGSEAEAEAAEYILDQLAGFGYDATLQQFEFEAFRDAGSTLGVVSPQPLSLDALAMEPSIAGFARGKLVDAGIGRPEEFPVEMDGKIALMERGVLFFIDKVANAAAAGAVAAIVYNDESGPFLGQLGESSPIPVASISGADGATLLNLMGSGPVEVEVDVRIVSGPQDSQNVVGRPPGEECRAVVGGHYDSVPAGPGANDNASGTATALEIARAVAAEGVLNGVCFVLFGAEEVGLIGSGAFVDSLTIEERRALDGMLNFDMVGVGTDWLIAGALELRDLAAAEADDLGVVYQLSDDAPEGLGSDHASFLGAGIPAVFFHRLGDPNYHTAGDQERLVQGDRLTQIGELGLAVLETLLTTR